MQLTKNISLFSIAAVGYYLLGYNLMYPLGTWSVDGVFSGVFGVAVMEAVGISADKADDISYATTGSDYFFPADVLCCYRVNRIGRFGRAH
jgi:Amt family ammonium transporter